MTSPNRSTSCGIRLARSVLLFGALAATTTSALARPPKVFSSTTERIRKLPLTGGGHYTYWTPYVVAVTGLEPSDVVQCHAQAEVTNPYGFTVQVDRVIARTPRTGYRGARKIDAVNPLYGENLTPIMHHMAITTWSTDTGQTGTVYYALVLEAASTAYRRGQALEVEQGYGGIWCTVFE